MKTKLALLAVALPVLAFAQINVGSTINDKANEKTGQAIDAVWNAPGKVKDKKKDKEAAKQDTTSQQSSSSSSSGSSTQPQETTTTSQPATIKTYQNYDFVA